LRVVFFGTPEFAVPTLRSLLNSAHEVAAVVTQPDRPVGRGRHMAPSPVKAAALEAGLHVIQPEKVRDADFINELKSIDPSVIVTVAYGQILPLEILSLPEKGCVNIHASLLPKYRGAAPINQAIINGDAETGITTMLMDEGMDTGDILLQKVTEIMPDETAGGLSERLSVIGADILLETLKKIESGSLKPEEQRGDASFAPLLKKSDGIIQWARPAKELHDFIRGMNPWPGAYTFIKGDMIKVLRSEAVDGDGEAGVVSAVTNNELLVGTGEGLLALLEVQPSGKRPMEIKAFLQGRKLEEGMRFNDKSVA
jgi:methionyl-tRNA formyltransferase